MRPSGKPAPSDPRGSAADLQSPPHRDPRLSPTTGDIASAVRFPGNAEKCASRNFTTLAFLLSGKPFYKFLGFLARNLHQKRFGLSWGFHGHHLGDGHPQAPLGIVINKQQ